MFETLPDEIQREIATYLDTPSLCFFALTSKRSLKNARPQLISLRQKLLRSMHGTGGGIASFCYTPNAIYAWGDNRLGQLGLGHTNDCTTLTRVTQLPPGTIQQVVTGSDHTLVLTDQGLYACGGNRFGQLGLGHTNDCTTFTPVTPLPPGTIQQVVAGSNHTFVLTDQGLYACGSNRYGQLGLGYHTKKCTTLIRVTQLPPGTIQQVVAGYAYTLVLTDQGLYACGDNASGQLGLGHTIDCSTLTLVTQRPPETIQQVVAGYNHTFVLTDQGLYACGDNHSGQLGLGHTIDCSTLTLVTQPYSELFSK
jgi:alpha-tubulin suppressor-like RCC1 family protein